jgi:signal transduction histidine kinase
LTRGRAGATIVRLGHDQVKKTRRGNPEWYDSREITTDPPAPRPPHLPKKREKFGSLVDVGEDEVAVAITSPSLAGAVREALRRAAIAFGGEEALRAASLVIVEGSAELGAQIAALRAKTRPDAALLLVLDPASPHASPEGVARAFAAGAFACLRAPFVAEELLGLVNAARDSRAAREEVATLSRKLDLESHLASLGRMSAGLTHEIANPLNVAFTNLSTIRADCAALLGALRAVAFARPSELATRLQAARTTVAEAESNDGLSGALRETEEAHARLRSLLETMRGLVGTQLEVRREPVDLLALARDVVGTWLASELQGVEAEVIGSAVVAEADPVLLGQIAQNLTANAIHAAKSLATPRVRLHAYESEGAAVISVRDNGPGIASELHERVFEPFYTKRRGQGGTGLGLALCREYAVRMGANLALWSIPGRGTCVRVSLPLARRG